MGYPGSPSLDDICCKISFIDIFKSKKVRLNLTYLKVFFRGEGGAKLNDQIFRVRRHSFDYVFEYLYNRFFSKNFVRNFLLHISCMQSESSSQIIVRYGPFVSLSHGGINIL